MSGEREGPPKGKVYRQRCVYNLGSYVKLPEDMIGGSLGLRI